MAHATYDPIVKILLESFPSKKKISILDFGCGDGSIISYIPKQKIQRYVGWEINMNSINRARERFKDGKYKFNQLDPVGVQRSLGLKKFDAVIAVGVLQYMSYAQIKNFIANARLIIKDGGVFITGCATDHMIYKITDVYRFFSPHGYINRKKIICLLKRNKFEVDFQYEKGLIISPLFSNVLTLAPDFLDKVFFQTRGSLGIFGSVFRRKLAPILKLEYLLPLDYGYTLYIKARR